MNWNTYESYSRTPDCCIRRSIRPGMVYDGIKHPVKLGFASETDDMISPKSSNERLSKSYPEKGPKVVFSYCDSCM